MVALTFHDEEYPERRGSARTVSEWFSRPSFQASTTACCDAGEIIGCVDYPDTPWHTGAGYPYNEATEGMEHDGYAHQSTSEWLDPYGVELLERSAAWFAWRCQARSIPPRVISAAQFAVAIATGNPADGGIIGHNTITQAAGVRGGHTDPGGGFPWGYFEERVLAHFQGQAQAPQAVHSEVVVYRRNAEARLLQGEVLDLQRLLTVIALSVQSSALDPGPADGLFGPQTEAAVLEFQRHALDLEGQPLDVDGIVGPKTWAALHFCAFLAQTGEGHQVESHSEAIPPLPYLLSEGMTDGYVRQWQQRMADRGWAITVDGVFGPATMVVLLAFQLEKGLDVDGLIGPATWAATWTSPVT